MAKYFLLVFILNLSFSQLQPGKFSGAVMGYIEDLSDRSNSWDDYKRHWGVYELSYHLKNNLSIDVRYNHS